MILSNSGASELLKFGSIAATTGTDPMWKGAKLMLYVNNVSVNEKTVFADLTEASFTGYARSAAIVWALPIISNPTGLPTLVGDMKTVAVTTNSVSPQTVFGFAIISGGGTPVLLATEPIPTPLAPLDGTQISIVPRIGLNPQDVSPAGDLTFE